jgi:hypothetical protein
VKFIKGYLHDYMKVSHLSFIDFEHPFSTSLLAFIGKASSEAK